MTDDEPPNLAVLSRWLEPLLEPSAQGFASALSLAESAHWLQLDELQRPLVRRTTAVPTLRQWLDELALCLPGAAAPR